jgi:uncharacterized membrane protein
MINQGAGMTQRSRIDSIDVLRGIIMILMALDHTRDFFGDLSVSPTNLATTSVPLFFARWITHFCAPVFFLLTGTGAFLSLQRMSRGQLSRFLLTRGLWLIFLEVTLIRFLWQFNLDYQVLLLNVIWALGWSMIVLGLLVYLPLGASTGFGILLIAGHNLFDGVQPATLGGLEPLWRVLHVPGFLLNEPGRTIFTAYPLIPWIGVTAVGYALGQIYRWEAARRQRFLLVVGLAAVGGFLILRVINIYGDPQPWSVQLSGTFTALSFINASKYPPSLLFLLMTLGPALLLLRGIDGGTPVLLRPALTYGRVPFFYYLLHILLLHLVAVLLAQLRFGDIAPMFQSPDVGRFPITQPPGWPLGLPFVYLIWISVVAGLYPLCRWFAGVRQRRKEAWLSYL